MTGISAQGHQKLFQEMEKKKTTTWKEIKKKKKRAGLNKASQAAVP